MPFSPVPKESKNQINKAGRILFESDRFFVKSKPSINDLTWAVDLAGKWRACHAYPINTFQATLRNRLRNYSHDSIVAQRLKRMPTIVNKLQRYPTMQLTTMQDIGGVRAVLGSIADVYTLADSYRKSAQFPHELIDEKDYIENPRTEDGYRSLHLIYKYKNKINPAYDGLRIEMQIRTKLQHTWATAVETMGTFLGQALKSRQGDQEWLDFFAITSSAFSYMEKSPRVPRYNNLSREETFLNVTNTEAKMGALEIMRGFSTAVNEILDHGGSGKGGWSYHLIILNSIEKTIQIKPYDRDSFERAMEDYSNSEKEAAKEGSKIEPVLVSAGPIKTLRRAYPNFFLDISEFVNVVTKILNSVKQIKN